MQGFLNSYNDRSAELETIKKHNSYIQESLLELKNLIDKAKKLEKFREKDLTFKAYYDSLDRIKNETKILQTNSSKSLELIEKTINNARDVLEVAKVFFSMFLLVFIHFFGTN